MSEGLQSSHRPRRQQRDLSNIPGFNHSRRSWTGNGMRVTMETATYASPGFSFRSSNGAGEGLSSFNNFVQPSRSRRNRGGEMSGPGAGLGLFGGAFNLFNDVITSQTSRDRPRRGAERNVYVVESDSSDSEGDGMESDDDLAYGSLPRAPAEQPKSVLGRLKDRILDHGRQRGNRTSDDHERSPPLPQRPQNEGSNRRRFQSESPEPPRTRRAPHRSTVHFDEKSPESSPERFTDVPRRSHDSHRARGEREIASLQRAVESERRQYLAAKRRFQEASQGSTIDPEYIQDLLNRVKVHGTLLASAQRKLQVAKEQQRLDATTRQSRPQRQPSPPRRASYDSEEDEEEEDFEPWPPRSFNMFSGTSRSIPRDESFGHTGSFDPYLVFDRLFADADSFSVHGHGSGFQFFAGPGGPSFRRTSFNNTNTGPSRGAGAGAGGTRPRPFTNTSTNIPPPQPTPQLPTNPLLAPEAATLFKTYNATWSSLSATFPTIPYPTRTLRAPALASPSTIPHPQAHTWSPEQIMQANTRLFFLLAHGLEPTISDLGVVAFNRAGAREADVKALVGVLKREKMRWHSDRLGRRNEEVLGGGVNEVLQRDERARAVFHGVCGLVEFAAGREG